MKIFARNCLVGGIFQPATIELNGDKITGIEIVAPSTKEEVTYYFDDGYLIPGLIDLQLNGVAGVDFSSGTKEEIEASLGALVKTGTTSLCPTVITSEANSIRTQLNIFSKLSPKKGSAGVLGVHLEGPVISAQKKGAHRLEHILTGKQFLESGIDLDQVKILTLAPEVEGASELIQLAKQRNVIVSLGHTMATADQTQKAKKLGATMVTHLFNAMPQIHQRDSGIAISALVDDSLFFGLIMDGKHVDQNLIELALRVGPNRAVIVSDASAGLLVEPGEHIRLGGEEITVSADGVAIRADGTIASSGKSQLEAIEIQVKNGLSRELLVQSATEVPAKILGESGLGRIEVGATADLVHYTVDQFPVVDLVLISGEKCPL